MTPLLLLLPYFLLCFATTATDIPKHHVVYMGSSSNGNIIDAELADQSAYLEMLSSIIPSHQRKRTAIIHKYNHAFRGFSATLTETEASILSGHDDVVSIFPDSLLKLHTTHSWDFLQDVAGRGTSHTHQRQTTSNVDVIIGVIDTGIWPESRSFNDEGIGAVPSRWKGICMEGSDF